MEAHRARLGNDQAWFTTAVLAEARLTIALLKRSQKVLKRLMLGR
jgi:hypothetical protein